MQEIERKFLVDENAFIALIKAEKLQKETISQGFLSRDPERTVRVRLKGEKGYLTIKGKGSKDGTTRFEWEREIDLKEAKALYALCLPGVIDKTRYLYPNNGFVWEIDVFHKQHQGLILAEIEVDNKDQIFEKPNFILKEVTGQKKYYNSQLSKHI